MGGPGVLEAQRRDDCAKLSGPTQQRSDKRLACPPVAASAASIATETVAATMPGPDGLR